MATFERDVLQRHPASRLAEDEDFIDAVAEIQGEFLAIHPFRERNARTIKLATNLLAVQTGPPLPVYDDSDAGAMQYIAGASAALQRKDYRLLEAIIRAALARARQTQVAVVGREFRPGSGP
jgi:cell filamentation protein